jgi:hypothetical protein
MTEDLDVFLSDFGVDIVAGSSNLRGIYNAPGELIASDQVVTTAHSVVMKTSDVEDWETEDAITVDSVEYFVKSVIPFGDGLFAQVTLGKA